MAMARSETAIISLEEARGRFEEWRNHRSGKARIPAELWSAAVEVARKEGINRTARELHVAWDDLKRRMATTGEVSRQPGSPAFVELVAPQTESVPECTLELEGGRCKLRIQLRGASASYLATLSHELLVTGANRVAVAHATLRSGDPCPECHEGKVYRQKDPKTLVRIVGRPPLEATVFEMERLRCNGCGEVFTASEPPAAAPEKFAPTAVAMIALFKYGTGMPFNRMERLEGQLGMPLPAATQWELMEAAAKLIKLVLDELIRQAAQGSVMHNDDTGMRILQLVRSTDDGRTGTFTSGIVSIWREWKIALYFTGWKHAGENLADVLRQRAPGLAPPIQMC
jgi:hypothetical protein